MKLVPRKEFLKNPKTVKNRDVLDEIRFVLELLEKVSGLDEVEGAKELKGRDGYYRRRIEDYRLGVRVERSTVELVCIYHRSVICSKFP